MLFIFWMFLVSQSKATGPNTHDQPINSYLQKSHQHNHQLQGAMSTHIRLSKHTNIMDQDFGGKNEPLPGIQPKKRGRLLSARVRRVSKLKCLFLCHDSLRCSKKDVRRRELSHWKSSLSLNIPPKC